MRGARAKHGGATEWQRGILARRPVKVAVLAQAAKTARIRLGLLITADYGITGITGRDTVVLRP